MSRARRVRPRSRAIVAIGALVASGAIGAGPFQGGSAAAADLASRPDDTVVTNGNVQAIVRSGDTIYIGGRFDRVGPRTGPGVEVALDGTQNTAMPQISGAGPTTWTGAGGGLSAVAPDGSGGWYVGGLFTHVGGVARTNLAHIRADRSVDPNFNPALNDGVHALAVSGAMLYAAGLFTSIDGQTRNRIAAFDTTTGTLTAFNPGANAGVESLALSSNGSILYAGGRFTVIGGLPRVAIAALNTADGSASPTFNPTATNQSGGVGVINALAISGSTLYVGGVFNSIGGQPRNNIAALSLGVPLDGAAVAGFDPSTSYFGCAACGTVSSIAVSGSTVYVGGLFDKVGGQSRKFLAGLNVADGLATAFNPSPNGNIFAVAVSGGVVYASGGFRSTNGSASIGGQARNYVAALNPDGTATSFNPNPNAIVSTFGFSGAAIYMGGYFSSLGGVTRRGIAAISATDGSVTAFNPNALGFNGGTATVYALAVSGSTVYAGGYFGTIGGAARGSIAALDTATGSATAWNPAAKYYGGPAVVETLAIAGSTVYAGGVFNSIGGAARNNVAALNVADGAATPFNANPNSEVVSLATSGSLLYVGGHFTAIGGQTRNKIAALNIADGSATAWNPDLTPLGNVLALAISGSTIYAGGNFSSVHGVARKNIAGIDMNDGTPTAFDPQAADPLTGGGVMALAVYGSTVYAAGFFTSIGGQPRTLLAGLRTADGSATSFDPHGAPGFGAFAVAVSNDGSLYAGGSFNTFDLAYQQCFAQFHILPAPVIVTPTAGALLASASVTISGTAGPDAAVSVREDATLVGTTTADGSGAWSVAHTFADGPHSVTATATDPAGNTGPVSDARAFSVDTTPPLAAIITTPGAGASVNTPTTTISGTAEAGSTVRVREGATLRATVTADGSGAWSVPQSFTEGSHTITATATDAAGNTGPVSVPRTFTLDTVAPAPPAIVTPTEGAELSDSFVALSGTAEPRASVTIREGASVLASVGADASGAWSAVAGLTNGSHVVVATATDAAGNASGASASRAFVVNDVTAPASLAFIASPAQDATVDGPLVEITGTADPGAAVRVLEGGTVLGAATVNAAGAWRLGLFGLSIGSHTIVAVATDPAGNAGEPSSPRTFSVRAASVSGLVITSPGQDSLQPGYVAFTGVGARSGVAVALLDGETQLGTVMPAADGSWMMGLPLATGAHSVVATSASVAPSPALRFTVDADPPAVSITTAPRAIFLPGDTVRIAGAASDNLSVVAVRVTYFDAFNHQVASQLATCACAPGATQVSWTSEPTVPSGSYTVVVQGVDEAGNLSPTRKAAFVTI